MDRGLLAEDDVEVRGRERARIERADPLADHKRAAEGLLHSHLLIEHEADQQCHRVGSQQRVGVVRFGEEEAFGHAGRLSAESAACLTFGTWLPELGSSQAPLAASAVNGPSRRSAVAIAWSVRLATRARSTISQCSTQRRS